MPRPNPAVLPLALLALAAPARAAVIYVNPNAPGAVSDGTSWATAFRSIQAAYGAAHPGDEVWVARGAVAAPPGLAAGVSLYGGFAGTETLRGQRDPARNESTIQQNLSIAAPIGRDTVVDGFTLAGATCLTSSPTLSHNRFHGTIYCSIKAAPLIADNTIVGAIGGGVHSTGSAPVITRNVIRRCYSDSAGGIFCDANAPGGPVPIITKNILMDNEGPAGGAIACTQSSAIIAGNVLVANIGGDRGAGFLSTDEMNFGGTIGLLDCSPRIVNNTIVGNDSPRAAINGSKATPIVANNLVAFNSTGLLLKPALDGSAGLANNCVYGNSGQDYITIPSQTGRNGNISVDPRFADLAHGNVRIQPNSPCRDAGNGAAVMETLDVEGKPRILGARVDIGAFESDGRLLKAVTQVVRVSPTGSDANDGASWASAKKTVAAALAALAALAAKNGGGEVWVAAGTYTTDPPASFLLPMVGPFRYLYGGFAGNEAVRAMRDPARNVATLRMPVSVDATYAGPFAALDGFTVTGGQNYGVSASGSALITHNVVHDSQGGILSRGAPTITDNVVTNIPQGGAISISGGAPFVARNIVDYNGPGIVVQSAAGSILNNRVTRNHAPSGGGISLTGACTTVVAGNLVADNTAFSVKGYENSTGRGGGIDCACTAAAFIGNNTIVGNTAVNGGGLYVEKAAPVLENNIVAFNSSGLLYSATARPATANDLYGNAAYDYSGPAGVMDGGGNVNTDPLFVGPASGNFHLLSASPLVDAGDDAALPFLGLFDLDGQLRLQGAHVDIGAYETLR